MAARRTALPIRVFHTGELLTPPPIHSIRSERLLCSRAALNHCSRQATPAVHGRRLPLASPQGRRATFLLHLTDGSLLQDQAACCATTIIRRAPSRARTRLLA